MDMVVCKICKREPVLTWIWSPFERGYVCSIRCSECGQEIVRVARQTAIIDWNEKNEA